MTEGSITPEDLRAEGYIVYFRHYRVPDGTKNKDSRHCKKMYPYNRGAEPWTPATKGGKTVCVILDRYRSLVARGETFCRSDENFIKKEGRNQSFKNALEEWFLHEGGVACR